LSTDVQLALSHLELVALYVALERQEEALDDHQKAILEKIRNRLYATLSVSEMEAIETYYKAIAGL
jgi:hypothetical protein